MTLLTRWSSHSLCVACSVDSPYRFPSLLCTPRTNRLSSRFPAPQSRHGLARTSEHLCHSCRVCLLMDGSMITKETKQTSRVGRSARTGQTAVLSSSVAPCRSREHQKARDQKERQRVQSPSAQRPNHVNVRTRGYSQRRAPIRHSATQQQKVSIVTEVELESQTAPVPQAEGLRRWHQASADVESRAREPHDYERGVR